MQSELANLVGASRQRINTNLQAWQRAGVVDREHGSLLVMDAEALGQVALSYPAGAAVALGTASEIR